MWKYRHSIIAYNGVIFWTKPSFPAQEFGYKVHSATRMADKGSEVQINLPHES
jgi:hypothetical protein